MFFAEILTTSLDITGSDLQIHKHMHIYDRLHSVLMFIIYKDSYTVVFLINFLVNETIRLSICLAVISKLWKKNGNILFDFSCILVPHKKNKK